MISVPLDWVAAQLGGQLHGDNLHIDSVSIDSRQVQPGALFIAIKGPRFDGHDYIRQALEAGAGAIVSDRPLALNAPVIVVKDTRHALGQLGAAVKARCQVKTVAVTGSSGKTTVKEMCANILRQCGQVLATRGNFNNDIGVPLTLLELTEADEYAVIELGANHLGEIAYTTRLTAPDVVLINNVSPAHVEGFGDIWGVARAKTEIVKGLHEHGVVFTNANSQFYEFWQRELHAYQHKVFALQGAFEPDNFSYAMADYFATDIQLDQHGCATFTLHQGTQTQRIRVPVPGAHNVANAVAAAALCGELGVSLGRIAAGIETLAPVPGRMQVQQVSAKLRVIDDTYNANVASAKAGLDVLASFSGYRVMVLGDMGELGVRAREYHEEVGLHALEVGIDNLFTLGVLSQSASQAFNGHGGQHFDSHLALTGALTELIQTQDNLTILIKGSRSARMERIVEMLIEQTTEHTAGGLAC